MIAGWVTYHPVSWSGLSSSPGAPTVTMGKACAMPVRNQSPPRETPRISMLSMSPIWPMSWPA